MCLLVVNFLTPVMENIRFQAFPILLRFHALLCFHYHRFMGCTIVYPAPFLEDHDKLLHENLCQGSRKICEATCVTSAGKVAKNWLVLSYFFIIEFWYKVENPSAILFTTVVVHKDFTTT